MLIIHLLYITFQINKIFPVNDIYHLVKPRLHSPKIRYLNGDLQEYRSIISPTQNITHVCVCMESTRMHFFLHDGIRFYNCAWEGKVSYEDKKKIVFNMKKWIVKTDYINLENIPYTHEDSIIFNEVDNMLLPKCE